jgi:hypothetical protein
VALVLEWDEVSRFDFKNLVWWIFTTPEAVCIIAGLIGLIGITKRTVTYYMNKAQQEQNLQQLSTQETQLLRFFKIFRPKPGRCRKPS